MKKLLLIALLIPTLTKAQIKDTSFAQVDERLRKSSSELIAFDKGFRSGIMLELAGGLVAVVGSKQDIQPLIIAGGVLGLFGFVMNISSSVHIKNAGIFLRGNSLVVPLARKSSFKKRK